MLATLDRSTSFRFWWIAVGLALSAGCATVGSGPTGGGRSGPAQVAQPMPALTVRTLAGDQVIRLEDLKGKVVLLDIWASWCAPCKEEMPLLDDLAPRLKARGVEILAVSIDEDRANAEEFLRSRPKWELTLAHDPEGKIPDALQPAKMPTSYIIDTKGIIRHVNAGFDRDDIQKIEAHILKLADAEQQ